MSEIKGELLYDETQIGKKNRLKYKFNGIMTGVSIIIMAFLGYLLYFFRMLSAKVETHIIINFIGLSVIFIGSVFIIGTFAIRPINIYQNGISGLQVGFSDMFHSRETFLPFSSIKTVYLNQKKPFAWITIIKKDGTEIFHHKDEIANFDEFIHNCRNRVEISTDDYPNK